MVITTAKIQPISGRQLRSEPQIKLAVVGPTNSGKTYTIIELLSSLILRGLQPSQIRIVYIDVDVGLTEILDQAPFPEEYLSCIDYYLCSTFRDILDATEAGFATLRDHVAKNNSIQGAYIIVDNMDAIWEMCRNDYCEAVYNMSLAERMAYARKTQMNAKKRGPEARGEAVFNQELDYAVINPLHNTWADSFKRQKFNYIWMSPWYLEELEDGTNGIKETRIRFGQKLNEFRVSCILRKYFDENGKRRCSFLKSRTTENLPRELPDTKWDTIWDTLKKVHDLEHQTRPKVLPPKALTTIEDSTPNKETTKSGAILDSKPANQEESDW